MNRLNTCITSLILLMYLNADAQISQGGVPFLLQNTNHLLFPNLETEDIPAFDLTHVKAEDKRYPGTARFAAPIAVNYDLYNAGEWMTLDNGDRIWKIKIKSNNALGLFFRYDQFQLPEGATLYMYDDDGKQIHGAYTSINNRAQFMTGMVKGAIGIVELYEPKNVSGQSKIRISHIYHAYQPDRIESNTDYNAYSSFDFGESLSCHVDANCPEGGEMSQQKRSIARIARIFEEGIGWCTGALINNANFDGTPYILSAFHCTAGFTPIYDLWRFDFDYQKLSCNNSNEPTFNSILGCNYVAGLEESDFALLELMDEIPPYYNVYFNGWNRSDVLLPTHTTILHHPRGDVKKVSVDDEPAVLIGAQIHWSNGVTTPPDHHFRSILDIGTIEPGSSGCPMFNEDGVIVGQLHGGNASCEEFVTYHGRLCKSWNEGNTPSTRLQDWLDPNNTMVESILGYDPNGIQLSFSTITGKTQTATGIGINNVEVNLSGNTSFEHATNESGEFSFPTVPLNGDYELTAQKNTDPLNGVTTFDLVLIQRHILGIQALDTPEKLIAADANQNGAVSTIDLVAIRSVILGINDNFPGNQSWIFTPNQFELNNLSVPLINQNFIGIKVGDVNDSVDPSN